MIEVNFVEAVADFGLVLTFNSGERRRFDMRPYLALSGVPSHGHPGYFSLARVDYGTVTWPDDIDIAPETLYDGSIPLAD
jgi:hypothetical protein